MQQTVLRSTYHKNILHSGYMQYLRLFQKEVECPCSLPGTLRISTLPTCIVLSGAGSHATPVKALKPGGPRWWLPWLTKQPGELHLPGMWVCIQPQVMHLKGELPIHSAVLCR